MSGRAHHNISPKEFRDRLGLRIRDARVAAGLSQIDLARQLNIGQATLCRIETGRTDSSVIRIHAIAEAVGTNINTLLEGLL